jgi:RimJ/RimL family protein N-acetyltransferase
MRDWLRRRFAGGIGDGISVVRHVVTGDDYSISVETDRLSLRPVQQDDLDPWATFLGDPNATRLLHFPRPHTREEAAALLERTIARADGAAAMYTVQLRETGDTIGFVGYTPRELDWGRELELGWLLLPAFHGRGYATEAASAARELVPGRVVSLVRVENTASQNVARKLGMTIEREIVFAGFATDVFVG